MKISKSVIEALKPCADRFNNFVANYGTQEYNLKGFLELDSITYSDKVWVVTRLFTKEQNVRWSIACANSVLANFENVYPDDKRPRAAIEAALAYHNNPSEENRAAADSAASAFSAARSAAYSPASAAFSARSAAHSAASAALALSAADSAFSARSVARSAAHSAASAADLEAEKDQEDLNLLLMLGAL